MCVQAVRTTCKLVSDSGVEGQQEWNAVLTTGGCLIAAQQQLLRPVMTRNCSPIWRNNILITGSGFSAPMTTNYTGGDAQMTIHFKVTDSELDFALYFKHWKTTDEGSVMTIIVNGNKELPITKHVDAKETEGGEMNLLTIVLRNKDYSSDDFYDYLKLGLNRIDITFSPANGITGAKSTSGYEVRAIAIG